MAKAQVFRANVGVIVVDRQGRVLALERSDRAGAWQLPQGGLHRGEEPLAAALRELREETGLGQADVRLIAEHPSWLAYELPAEARSDKTGRGQVQKWFLFELAGEIEIDLEGAEAGEFGDHRWMKMADLARATWVVRRGIYQELLRHFADRLA
jgi:putative (di)nucleoside polyphosphate hydrolase